MANLGHSLPNSKAGVHYLMTQDCKCITKMHKPFYSPLDFYNNSVRTCARLRLRNSALSGSCWSHSSPKPSIQKWHPIKCINKCNCSLLHQLDFAAHSLFSNIGLRNITASLHFPHHLISNLCKISSDCLPHFPLIFPPKKSTIFCRKPSSLGSGGADRDSSCGFDPPPPE